MTRFLFTTLLSFYAFLGFAQLNGDNFYRLQNHKTQRYVYVYDNRGSISLGTTSADLGALQLWLGFEKAASDPASIVYVMHVSGRDYRFHSQGTNSFDIVGYDLKIIENESKKGTYSAYQTKSGMTSYLCDERTNLKEPLGLMGTNVPSKLFKYWNVHPVTTSGYYFGLVPQVTVGTELYASFFAEFAGKFASEGMEAFYVNKVDKGMAVIEAIQGDVIPEATPLIVKCVGPKAEDNKLDLLRKSNVKVSSNQLRGVYFCNDVRNMKHRNVTPYNPETMRLLGVSEEGKLVFKKSDVKYLPANQAYLSVPVGSPDEISVVTQKEFDDIIASGIDGVLNETKHDSRIYNLFGVLVGEGLTQLKQLPAGVYIMGGKKHIVK